MNIIVCVKQTPDTAEVELKLDESGSGIRTRGLVFEMNEWDEYAIEEALLLKEKLGGSVTAVTMGPDGADAVLRRCLAKGVDQAMWLKDEAFESSDAFTTAKVLYAAIKNLEYELVFTGAQASDDGHGVVGGVLAGLLGIPYVPMVKKVEAGGVVFRVNRELEGGLEEVIELDLPALLSIQTGINEPRYVSIMGIRRARKKAMTILSLGDLGLTSREVGQEGSWLKIERMYHPPVDKEPEMLRGTPDEVSERLVDMLKTRGLV